MLNGQNGNNFFCLLFIRSDIFLSCCGHTSPPERNEAYFVFQKTDFQKFTNHVDTPSVQYYKTGRCGQSLIAKVTALNLIKSFLMVVQIFLRIDSVQTNWNGSPDFRSWKWHFSFFSVYIPRSKIVQWMSMQIFICSALKMNRKLHSLWFLLSV